MTTMTDEQMRELDAWIAEHVMGWKITSYQQPASRDKIIVFGLRSEMGVNNLPDLPRDYSRLSSNSIVPHYTTDPAAAMQVLEKCAIKLAPNRMHVYGPTEQFEFWLVSDCEASNASPIETAAETLPLAICLFAKSLFNATNQG